MPWVRNVYYRGGTVQVTLPKSVVGGWAADGIHRVRIDYEPPCLVITPLTDAELRRMGRTEQEEPTRGPRPPA